MRLITVNPVYSIETGELLSHDGMYWWDGPVISFDRALTKMAENDEQQARNIAGNQAQQAAQVGSVLIPGEERMALNPTGYSPADLATMKTANLQTARGTAGSLQGQLAERAARMRNPAGYNAATAAASQGASRAAGTATNDILAQNAKLKQQQQQSAFQGLNSIYGADNSDMLKAMGLETGDIDAATNAEKVGWLQNLEGGLSTLGSLGQGAGSVMTGLKA